jgi:hypothetical protein
MFFTWLGFAAVGWRSRTLTIRKRATASSNPIAIEPTKAAIQVAGLLYSASIVKSLAYATWTGISASSNTVPAKLAIAAKVIAGRWVYARLQHGETFATWEIILAPSDTVSFVESIT